MALRTLHAGAEEELRHVLHLLLLLFDLSIPRHGRAVIDVACGGDDFTHEAVVRFVVRDAVADPLPEKVGAACINRLRPLIAQQCRPLVREELRVVRAVEQAIDERGALVRVLRGHEVLHFACGRQSARDVERDTADESAVISDFGGRDADGLQFGENEIVHEVAHRRQTGHRSPQRHRGAERGHFALIPHHHRDIAGQVKELHEACFARVGHRFLIGLIKSTLRHIARRAVGVMCGHFELLGTFEWHGELGRLHADAGHLRIAILAIRHAFANPAHEVGVVFGVRVELLPAAVGELRGAFRQKQALLRRSRKDTATTRLLHDVLIVLLRLKTEQRELEAVLPARFAVAPAAVAAAFGQNGNDVVREVQRTRCIRRESRRGSEEDEGTQVHVA